MADIDMVTAQVMGRRARGIEELIKEAGHREFMAGRRKDAAWEAYNVAKAEQELAMARLRKLRGHQERGEDVPVPTLEAD